MLGDGVVTYYHAGIRSPQGQPLHVARQTLGFARTLKNDILQLQESDILVLTF